VRNLIVSIGVVDEHWFTRECITRSFKAFDESLDVVSFRSCDECLRSTSDLDLIVYHAHQALLHDYNDAIKKDRSKTCWESPPQSYCPRSITPTKYLKHWKAVHVATSPTATTSLELTIEIIRLVCLVRAGGTFVPASSLSLNRYSREGSTSRARTTDQFTPRQMAVLHYLRLGKANKEQAYELALSEGTVKAHIRNIMEKTGVTNRTEVACRAQALGLLRPSGAT
jgi:DNA-binding CsgD family transcriptional regulator